MFAMISNTFQKVSGHSFQNYPNFLCLKKATMSIMSDLDATVVELEEIVTRL